MTATKEKTLLPAGLVLVPAMDRRAAWHQAANDRNNELFAWTYTDMVSLVGLPMWRELHVDEELSQYQSLVIHQETDEIVAVAYCVPFFCPQLDSALAASLGNASQLEQLAADWGTKALPAGGWGTLIFRAVRQAYARQGKVPQAHHGPWTEEHKQELTGIASSVRQPNALCGLFVGVKEAFRRQGIADALLMNFKCIARHRRLAVIAVPVHLTARRKYMNSSFEQYFRWSQGNPNSPEMSWLEKTRQKSGENGNPMMPFDPWLRKHFELGAKLVKIAPRSVHVSMPAAKWLPFIRDKYKSIGGDATDINGDGHSHAWQEGDNVDGAKLDGVRPGPLFPEKLKWDAASEVVVYEDSDVWVLHGL